MILTVLSATPAGSATRAEVLTGVDQAFSHRWTPEDLTSPPSRPWDMKWRNQASWERQRMVEEGLLSNAKPGLWILTEAGFGAAAALTVRQAVRPDPADEMVMRAIRQRRGQADFRSRLLLAYGGRCAFSGCDAAPTLEAAHITPHSAGGGYDTSNGLLLRADLHVLFDLHLVTVDLPTMGLLLHPDLQATTYSVDLSGRSVALAGPPDAPDRAGLLAHRRRSGL